MPQRHRGNVQQVSKQYAFHTEMTEKYDGILVCVFCPVKQTFPNIAVVSQKLVKACFDPGKLLCYTVFGKGGFFKPFFRVIEVRAGGPVCREPIPEAVRLVMTGLDNGGAELLQPGECFCGAPQRIQGYPCGILGTSQRGYIEIFHIQLGNAAGQQLCFLPTGFSEGVNGIIRVSMADNQQFHKHTLFLFSLYYMYRGLLLQVYTRTESLFCIFCKQIIWVLPWFWRLAQSLFCLL